MEFRKAQPADLDGIMKIIQSAQKRMAALGIDQWQDGYPQRELIEQDMEQGTSYLLEDDGAVLATVSVSFDGEPTYAEIYEGAWLQEGGEYAVVHRLAVTEHCVGKGIASVLLTQIQSLCRNNGVTLIRVDTHEGNEPMRRLLEKNLYSYCGVILLEDGSRRIAFEKGLCTFVLNSLLDDEIYREE